MTQAHSFLLSILDAIEQREAKLLVWGYVDGSFGRAELYQLIDPLIDEALAAGREEFDRAEAVLAEMLKRGLLIEVATTLPGGAPAYRSRMAETARLLLRLRQMFPKHGRGSDWQQAPTLVADFRFLWRRRQYPRRDVPAPVALDQLQRVTSDAGAQAALRTLLIPSSQQSLTLAGFQVRATERILRGLEEDALEGAGSRGTIVCAGTGSGKTLAFYISALVSIVRHRFAAGSERSWVKVVALYPRTELLKDQLREVLQWALRLDDLLANTSGGTIRIGALFGDTPESAKYINWPAKGPHLACPMLCCMQCEGTLLWRLEDRKAGRERLTCDSCAAQIDEEHLVLTRAQMREAPPDILFTTTEMLNQRLSDSRLNHLFGIGHQAARAPDLVLLDEVHAYDGRHGAHVAYLLRRWRHLLGQPLNYVGLSATLREAAFFFASLTSLRQNLVEEVSPYPAELEVEGAEYLIALRGDPVSRAALLSTTIQSAMLLARTLDSRASPCSEGVFGQRTFLFTDDLDATNRLYFDLLSAEGRDSWKRPDMRRAPDGGLAVLRRRGISEARYRYGQDWRACEALGHDLSDRLHIERVSSQDRGIDPKAEIVVATAALEVGFDDPMVGAVIQHKAPRGMAGFLQRKGRAGRKRGMRPWTAVVLSDYGRDRIVYQAYDQLFDPELPVRSLPLANRYVTRMQAVYAAMDFFARRMQDFSPAGSIWRDLAEPASPAMQGRQVTLTKELARLLESSHETSSLAQYLVRALDMSSDEVSALLWEYPRPLLTTVLPTALRRLATQWRYRGIPEQDYQVSNNPLPDFVPATLFADLNLAEVRLQLEGQHWRDPRSQPVMPVLFAIREFAPGRVSRRFGVSNSTERYWIGSNLEGLVGVADGIAATDVEVSEFGSYARAGTFAYWVVGMAHHVEVMRPIELKPVAPPRQVADASNGQPLWHTQLIPAGEPLSVEPPQGSVWQQLVPRLDFFTHAHQAQVEVRRFATGAVANLITRSGESVRLRSHFVLDGQPVALGLGFAADGAAFVVHIPAALHQRVGPDSDVKWRSLRTARYLARAWEGDALSTIASPFLREWLAQVYMSALTYEAIAREVSLQEAATALAAGTATVNLDQVLELLFQSTIVDDEGDTRERSGRDKLRQEIERHLGEPVVVSELQQLAALLWEPISAEWEQWLRTRYHSTLAAALLRAIVDLCPTIDPDALVVDLDRGPRNDAVRADQAEIWVTESSPGGSGLIEEFLRRYAEDPRRFFSMVRAALEMGEFELIDHQLVRLVRELADPVVKSETREMVGVLRDVQGHEELVAAHRHLRRCLVRAGYAPFHGFLVALANRVLRPGTGSASDSYLAKALQRWKSEEARLGLEIDLRVVAYWLAQSNEIDAVAAEGGVALPAQDLVAWRMSAIYGLLWPRGRAIRQAALPLHNRYAAIPPSERLLVLETLVEERFRISVEAPDWLTQAFAMLASGRLVTLTCGEANRERLNSALTELVTNPIEIDYLRAYARLQGIRQATDFIEADIELPEVAQ